MAVALSACALCGPALATNAPPAADATTLLQEARRLERDGKQREAAEACERVLALDPSRAFLLEKHLARLYAQQGDVERALPWARKAAERMPEPAGFLAGIYALAGRLDDARRVVTNELVGVREPRRRIALLWQLADVEKQAGAREAEQRALEEAARLAQGRIEQGTAQRLLKELHRRPAPSGAASE
jgi:tetratricopeptide (TPR) repeat protein